MLTHFEKQETQKGISSRRTASHGSLTSWTSTSGLNCRPLCMRCVRAFLKQIQPYLRSPSLVWDPILASQTHARLFLQQTLHQNRARCGAPGLFISVSETVSTPSLLSRNNRVRRPRTCAWASAWAFGEPSDAGRLRWRHPPGGAAHCQLRRDSCTCEMNLNLTKTL